MKYLKLLFWILVLAGLCYGCFIGFQKFSSGEWSLHKVPIVRTIDEMAR